MSDNLAEALRACLKQLTALVAESGRSIEWGEEDAFRMGEWFEQDELARIGEARAALAAYDAAPPAVGDAVLAALEPLPNRGHKTRFSDSSQYDEVCLECGMTDATHSKHNTRNTDCPKAPTLKERILAALVPAASPAPPPAVEELIMTAQWARNRLEAIADESWHGDARDFKRALVGVFADFDEALAKCGSAMPAALAPAALPAPDDEGEPESRDYIRGWNDAMKAGRDLVQIDPPPEPWSPPPEADRPYGYRCLGWLRGEWETGTWTSYGWSDEYGGPEPDILAPLPSAPAQKGEAT